MEYRIIITFFNALAVNYLVFYLMISFFRAETKVWRLTLAGAIYAGVATFGSYIDADITLLKAILSIVGILISKEDFTFGEFIRFSSLYIVLRLMLAGAESLFDKYFDGDNYFDITVSAAVLLCVSLFKAATGIRDVRKQRQFEYKTEIIYGGKSYICRGFVDTGNALYKDGKPVIALSPTVRDKLGLNCDDALPVGTLAGIKELPVTAIEFKIYYDKKTHKLYNSFAVISDKMRLRGYDVLLHKDMLK